jgi:hypothetical protein
MSIWCSFPVHVHSSAYSLNLMISKASSITLTRICMSTVKSRFVKTFASHKLEIGVHISVLLIRACFVCPLLSIVNVYCMEIEREF